MNTIIFFILFLSIILVTGDMSATIQLQIPQSKKSENSISLVSDAKELFSYEKPALSPDGSHIAWVVRNGSEKTYIDPENKNWFVDFFKGCKILIGGITERKNEEIFVGGSSCWGPSWSPDGEELAFYKEEGGNVYVWIYSLKDKKSRKVTSPPVFLTPPSTQKILWSPNKKEIYFQTNPNGSSSASELAARSDFTIYKSQISNNTLNHNKQPNTTLGCPSNLISVNRKNDSFKILLKSKTMVSNILLSPSGKWLCYNTSQLLQDPALKIHGFLQKIDAISSQGEVDINLSEGEAMSFDHSTNYIWHPIQDHLYYLADKKLWVAKFSEDGLISKSLLRQDIGEIDSSTLAFTRDGKNLIIGLDTIDTHDPSIEHATKLAIIPLEGGEIRSFSLPREWLFEGLIQNKNRILWQPDPETISLLLTCKNADGKKAVAWINLISKDFRLIWQGFAGLRPFEFSGNHEALYALFEDYYHPKEIYVFDSQLKAVNQISKTEPAFESLQVGSYELFDSLAPGLNGKMEKVKTGILLPPGAKKGDRLPAVVMEYPGADLSTRINDFGGGDNINGFPCLLLTNSGYAVILPNLVMGEESIGKPIQVMTDRLLPQVYQASNLGYIDLNRLGIMGQSYGGYGAAGIISSTDIFCAAVAVSGTYDLGSFSYLLNPEGENLWLSWAEADQGRMGKSLFEDPRRYIENSPFYRADKINTPLLLIHGKLDDGFSDATKMFSALRRLKRPVELVVYHKGHHCIGDMLPEDSKDAANRILEFFEMNLKNNTVIDSNGGI